MINNAVLHLLLRELTENGESEHGWMRVDWVMCALCVCVWWADDGELLCIYPQHGWTHIISPWLCIVFSWMSLVCHTHHVSLHVADNEHINMYISSWVNACLALQFHGLVSGWGSFHSTKKLWCLSIRCKKKYVVLNYWTDTWLTGWVMKLKEEGNRKGRKNRNWHCEVDWC